MAGTEHLIELDGLGHRLARRECSERVVRREAAKAKVVQASADFLRVREGPAEVRRVELNHLVAYLCDHAQRIRQIAGELTANGVELDADRVLFRHLRWRSRARGRVSE